MSQLSVFKAANLPSVKAFGEALKKVQVADPGTIILKMDKTGQWIYGADQTEVEDDSTWAINPLSFIHGFIAWGENEVLGEKMAPITEPLPEMDAAPAGSKRGWETQVGFSVKCLSGEDEGLEARFATTSVGGKRAVQNLGLAIAEHIEQDSDTPVPIVTLSSEFYKHKTYGKIYTPIFTIAKWISLDPSEPAKEDVKKVAAPEAEAEAEVVEDAPVETGRRRRSRG